MSEAQSEARSIQTECPSVYAFSSTLYFFALLHDVYTFLTECLQEKLGFSTFYVKVFRIQVDISIK